MAVIRYNPNRAVGWPNIWDEFDRLTGLSVASDSTLAVDVYETDHDVVVKMPVAGIKPDDLDITVTGDTVTVRGESKTEAEEDGKRNYYYREVRYGSFARSVTLPAPVKSDKAEAKTEDGVLTLTLPKAEEAKPKSIKVKSGDKP
jgi:HSP20 family protein